MKRSPSVLATTLKRLWHEPRFTIGKWGFIILLFIAVFGDFMANEKPLYARIDGKSDLPAARYLFSRIGLATWTLDDAAVNWKDREYERVMFAPVPYSSRNTDLSNANFKSPFGAQTVRSARFRHWLGTDHLGRDVLAGLIYGTRVALLVGLCSMLLAAFVGIPVGAISGYLGDDKCRMRVIDVVITCAGIILAVYFATITMISTGDTRKIGFLLTGMSVLIPVALSFGLRKVFRHSKQIVVPVDSIILRGIEVVRSVPVFFLLFAILGMMPSPGLFSVILLIALLWSPSIVRFVRAEALKLRDQTFIQSARVVGLSDLKIVSRHVIPNAIGPALITIAFGMGSAVLIESALSFLGIGISPDVVTWGKMLNLARSNISAWWIAVLPGLGIFCTIAIFNRLGDVLESQIAGNRD